MNKPVRTHGEHDGQVLVLFAIASLILIAFLALSVDAGLAMSERRGAQNAADAASLAVARAMMDGKTELDEPELRQTAVHYAQQNGYDIANPAEDIEFDWDTQTVDVLVSHEVPRAFLGAFYDGDWSVSADAAASLDSVPADYGLIALDEDGDAINATGNTHVRVRDGGIMSNADVNCTGSSTITAGTAVHAAGDILDTSQLSIACLIEGENGGESSGRAPIEDPLAGTPQPPDPVYPSGLPAGNCVGAGYPNPWNPLYECSGGHYTSWSWGSTYGLKLLPGTYYFDNTNFTSNPWGTGEIEMVDGGEYTFYVRNATFNVNNTTMDMGGADVDMYFLNSTFNVTGGSDVLTLGSGLYYFDNSHFNPASGATARGDDVAFFFRNGGSLVSSGHTTDMQFTAPEYELYPGMQPNLLVHAPANPSFELHLSAYSMNTELNGIVYLPEGHFRLTGNTGGDWANGQLIVGRFSAAGSSTGYINYESLIDMGTPSIWLVR